MADGQKTGRAYRLSPYSRSALGSLSMRCSRWTISIGPNHLGRGHARGARRRNLTRDLAALPQCSDEGFCGDLTCLTSATMRLTSDGRPSARKRGYTVRWEKAARRFLLKHPVCTRFGKDKGCTTVAQHVDHVTPHSGDLRLFWDRHNWQGLCQPCHNRKTAKERIGGQPMLYDEHGMPMSPDHHWNQR